MFDKEKYMDCFSQVRAPADALEKVRERLRGGGMPRNYRSLIIAGVLVPLFVLTAMAAGLSGVFTRTLEEGEKLEGSMSVSSGNGSREEKNVSIDGEPLDEPYLTEKSLGECDIELPYQVPEGRYFVMGDNRGVSSDSRSSQVGCIAEERIIGELIFTLWPLSEFGTIE